MEIQRCKQGKKTAKTITSYESIAWKIDKDIFKEKRAGLNLVLKQNRFSEITNYQRNLESIMLRIKMKDEHIKKLAIELFIVFMRQKLNV